MNRVELRKMIREEVNRVIHDELPDIVDEQIYTILPSFIKEALGSVVQKAARKASRQPNSQPPAGRRLVSEAATEELPEELKAKLRATMGYGDLDTMKAGEAKVPSTIAGVAMEGGLLQKETNYGQASTRDYTVTPDGGALITEGSSMPTAVETTPALGHMPDFLKNAVQKAKDVYDSAQKRNNWRPGMRK